MCEIKFHVKLPIFVARQWIRHRTANVNEYSARYSILDREFYVPDREYLDRRMAEEKTDRRQLQLFDLPDDLQPDQLAMQSQSNRQGRGDILSDEEARHVLRWIERASRDDYKLYLKLMNVDEGGQVKNQSRQGVARELARMVLPANVYTQWYWKIDLHNLLHFLSLRADLHAQYEIREYARVMLSIVKSWVPMTYDAFVQNRLNAVTLSAAAIEVLKRMIEGEDVSQEASGLGKREWYELRTALGKEA
jgi:thymidylate synthase (FAD)